MPKAKQARPPPDDPAQSERFMKDAAELMSADGAQLYERAMETLVQPTKLPAQARKPIIGSAKAGKKKPAGTGQR
jgi:hypothetical protein